MPNFYHFCCQSVLVVGKIRVVGVAHVWYDIIILYVLNMYKYVAMLKSCLNSTFTVPLCVNLLCQGAEEKDGVGECSCDTEYQGVSCQECTKGYYNESDSCLGEDAIVIPLSLIYAYLIAPKLSPTSPQLLFTLSFPFSPPIAHLLPSTHLPSTSPPLLLSSATSSIAHVSSPPHTSPPPLLLSSATSSCAHVSSPPHTSPLSPLFHTLTACDKACKDSCNGSGPGQCEQCAGGYEEDKEGVCTGE